MKIGLTQGLASGEIIRIGRIGCAVGWFEGEGTLVHHLHLQPNWIQMCTRQKHHHHHHTQHIIKRKTSYHDKDYSVVKFQKIHRANLLNQINFIQREVCKSWQQPSLAIFISHILPQRKVQYFYIDISATSTKVCNSRSEKN